MSENTSQCGKDLPRIFKIYGKDFAKTIYRLFRRVGFSLPNNTVGFSRSARKTIRTNNKKFHREVTEETIFNAFALML